MHDMCGYLWCKVQVQPGDLPTDYSYDKACVTPTTPHYKALLKANLSI